MLFLSLCLIAACFCLATAGYLFRPIAIDQTLSTQNFFEFFAGILLIVKISNILEFLWTFLNK